MENNKNIVAGFIIATVAIGMGLYFNELDILLSTGYYFILISFIFWIYAFSKLFCPTVFCESDLACFINNHRAAFILPLVIIISATLISPPEFKILNDETNLIATSKTMFSEHQIHVVKLNIVGDFGEPENLLFGVDMRGLFFPFMVSVVHTFFGYDAHNGFIVNIVSGYLLLLVFYLLLIRWFSKESAILGMVMLSAYPIIITYTLSSGFEILNLLFVVLSFYLLDLFLENKDWRYADALLLSLVLLAQIRYESAIFSVILTVVLAFNIRQHSEYKFSLLTYVTPFLFLPVLWQRLTIRDYQLPANIDQAFGLDNLIVNAPQWWSFFSGADQSYGVIGIVFFMSIAGLVLIISKIIFAKQAVSSRAKAMTSAALFSFIPVALTIMLFWSGSLVDAFVSRLAIVFIPLIVFFAIVFIENLIGFNKSIKKLFPLAGLLLLLLYWPEVQKNTSVNSLEMYWRYHLTTDYLDTNYQNKKITIVDPYTNQRNIHGWGAISFPMANANMEYFLERLKNNTVDELIVMENITFPAGEVVEDGYKLNDGYKLEELYVRRFRDDASVRISKVVVN